MVSSSSTRTKVFISYSHNDARYLRQLVEHLAYYERKNLIEFWSDEKITAGAQWREEIKRAIEFTKVAVLLISPSFLASEFIAENELPPLLHAAKEEGAIILPVIVRSSNFEDTELAKFQAVNSPSKPVAGMKPYQRDEFWAKVVRDIKNAVIPQQDESNRISRTSTRAQIIPEMIPPYVPGLNSTKPAIFLNSFSQALEYQDVQNVELHTHIQQFVAICDESVIRPSSGELREYGWKEIRELMLADKLEFEFPQYAQRNPPLSGARAHLPDTGNFYVIGMVDNKGFVLPISHFVSAVFVFTCVTCGSESTWAWKSVYICD